MTMYMIPGILVATAIIAGVFAFSPVDDATAVHTTIQNTQMSLVEASDADSCVKDLSGTTINATSDADFIAMISMNTGAAEATLAGSFTDGLNSIVLEILDDEGVNVVMYYPGGTILVLEDTASDLDGCITIITEGSGDITFTSG